MPKHPRDTEDTEDTEDTSEAKRPRLFYPEIFLPDQDSQGNVLYEAQQVPSEDEVYVGGDADSDAETVVDAGETVKETVKEEETLEEEETEEKPVETIPVTSALLMIEQIMEIASSHKDAIRDLLEDNITEYQKQLEQLDNCYNQTHWIEQNNLLTKMKPGVELARKLLGRM